MFNTKLVLFARHSFIDTNGLECSHINLLLNTNNNMEYYIDRRSGCFKKVINYSAKNYEFNDSFNDASSSSIFSSDSKK